MTQCGLYIQWPVLALSWCGFPVVMLVLKVGKLAKAQTRDLWDKVFWDKSFSHLLIKFIKSCENDLTQNTLLFTLTWLYQNQLGPISQLTLSTYSYHQPMRSGVIKYTKPAVSIDCDINPPPPTATPGLAGVLTFCILAKYLLVIINFLFGSWALCSLLLTWLKTGDPLAKLLVVLKENVIFSVDTFPPFVLSWSWQVKELRLFARFSTR